jgi:hypothetical protein
MRIKLHGSYISLVAAKINAMKKPKIADPTSPIYSPPVDLIFSTSVANTVARLPGDYS